MRIATLSVMVALVSCSPVARADERPNFIVINTDDLGYADIGPFGSKLNATPNLDRLAAEGRKLTCFYAAPVCSPSRSALMTGCYPKRVLTIPGVLFPIDAAGLAPQEITVAEVLKELGYATACVGKWHLGDQPEFLPTRQGFDFYFGLPYSNDMGPAADGIKSSLGEPLPKRVAKNGDQPPLPLLRNETVIERVLPAGQQALVSRYTEEVVKFIDENRERPFFVYLPHSAVHFPMYPSQRFVGTSQSGLRGDWVQEVDWSVGQIMDAVRRLDLAERTLVIFTSDNGGPLNQKANNTPLRGGKGTTFEGGMRVPTIVWWPGKVPPGTSTDAVTGMFDILPTLAKLAGGQPPADRKLDGADIWPILSGEEQAVSPHADLFYFYRGLKLEAVRSGNWKLHLEGGELYDLDGDIGETTDVASGHADVVARLRALADEANTDLGTDGIGPGCRALGKVADPRPLIDREGNVREGFAGETKRFP